MRGFRRKFGVAETRQNGLTTVFSANSIAALVDAQVQDVPLRPGQRFLIDMNLTLPVARAFDLAGAELIFRSVMPPGLELEDVRSISTNDVRLVTRVVDVVALNALGIPRETGADWQGFVNPAQLGQGSPMQLDNIPRSPAGGEWAGFTNPVNLGQEADLAILPLVIGIAAFIGSNWIGLSLLAIGLTFSLGFLVSAITGSVPLSGLGDVLQQGGILLLIGAAIVVAVQVGTRRRALT
jgi:hypothetical protein